jgi:hypothetical protein
VAVDPGVRNTERPTCLGGAQRISTHAIASSYREHNGNK